MRLSRHASGDNRNIKIRMTPAGMKKFKSIMKHVSRHNINLEAHFTAKELSAQNVFFKKLNLIIEQANKKYHHR